MSQETPFSSSVSGILSETDRVLASMQAIRETTPIEFPTQTASSFLAQGDIAFQNIAAARALLAEPTILSPVIAEAELHIAEMNAAAEKKIFAHDCINSSNEKSELNAQAKMIEIEMQNQEKVHMVQFQQMKTELTEQYLIEHERANEVEAVLKERIAENIVRANKIRALEESLTSAEISRT